MKSITEILESFPDDAIIFTQDQQKIIEEHVEMGIELAKTNKPQLTTSEAVLGIADSCPLPLDMIARLAMKGYLAILQDRIQAEIFNKVFGDLFEE